MPTNQNAYNSRVTDEALEKRFRDTFRAQGGSELVDDLYASGVIVPVVDFTAAATGQQLAENLQTAWDFATGVKQIYNGTQTLTSTAGFWKLGFTADINYASAGEDNLIVRINDGVTSKTIFQFQDGLTTPAENFALLVQQMIVFLRSGDSLQITTTDGINCWANYRQIATVSGDLVNPSGFTSS